MTKINGLGIKERMKKALDAKREPKANQEPKAYKAPKIMLFSIRNKLVFSFLVPIAFMVFIGASAYQRAADGMSQKFRDSTGQTISMAMDYIDMSCTFIESEGTKYAFDTSLSKYFMGLYKDDPLNNMNVTTDTKSDILTSQISNPFISNIHIITKEGINMFTTHASTSRDGFLETYRDSVSVDGRNIEKWIDSHSVLDENLNMKEDSYILAYETLSQSNNACIVIDIKTSAIEEFIGELDLGDGSVIGFVTQNGREVLAESLKEGQESILTEGESLFFGQDFFTAIDGNEELAGANEVTYKGENYLFIYSRSEKTGATMCALVPLSFITSQAEEIKSLTATLVILACVVVLAIGFLIAAGIQNNMKRISRKFGEVAKGDLTVEVRAKGRDEFRGLAGSATNMIANTKSLVNKVSDATWQLEKSAKEVEQASGIINEYSTDITRAISDINEGMSQQSEHARECVVKTDILSNEIQSVSLVVEKVEKLVDETEGMINKGMEIVRNLGGRARETTEITEKVGESIQSLRNETEMINGFVETITDISEQTNLLSLNASIEAARAGDAGRGFAVVAEEIRKLADNSAKAAGEIRFNVEHIGTQTLNSVESAGQARSMVALQAEAVEEVVSVFKDMQLRMGQLIDGLKEIVEKTDKADSERSDAVDAVKNISNIIEGTAGSAETVNEVANKLLENVENLNRTAAALGDNMEGLKSEISVFKI